MVNRAKSLWLNLSKSLGFIPGLIVLIFAALGIALVELDKSLDLDGVAWVFAGDGSAARTVLSVIAGSLITVGGLTFSITMVVLQLASSQFSPRILRTFFADRITQVTIGTYIGTFVYSILVLRAVGSFADAGFVPRLSVSIAALLGIAAVVLLIVYLHHVSRMVQVSQVTADIAADTLARIDALMPEPYAPSAADPQPDDPANAPAQIHARRAGYVQYVSLGDGISDQASRVAILVCPGDFVGVKRRSPRVPPPPPQSASEHQVLAAVTIAGRRDLDQDVDFGIRQLTDIALRGAVPRGQRPDDRGDLHQLPTVDPGAPDRARTTDQVAPRLRARGPHAATRIRRVPRRGAPTQPPCGRRCLGGRGAALHSTPAHAQRSGTAPANGRRCSTASRRRSPSRHRARPGTSATGTGFSGSTPARGHCARPRAGRSAHADGWGSRARSARRVGRRASLSVRRRGR